MQYGTRNDVTFFRSLVVWSVLESKFTGIEAEGMVKALTAAVH